MSIVCDEKDKTNGEEVKSCQFMSFDEETESPVREVEMVAFGKHPDP